MDTSGVTCKSFNIAAENVSMVIVVSRGMSVALGFGPMVMSMPSTAEREVSGVEYADCVLRITINTIMNVDAKTAARIKAARMFLEKLINSHWLVCPVS